MGQPNTPEKRVLSSSSLVVLKLAPHPSCSSSTASQMDKAIVDQALVQQDVQIDWSCTGVCEHAGQTQAAKPDPCIPTVHPLM